MPSRCELGVLNVLHMGGVLRNSEGRRLVVLQHLVRVEDWELQKIHLETGSPWKGEQGLIVFTHLLLDCLFLSWDWTKYVRAKVLVCWYELALCRESLVVQL